MEMPTTSTTMPMQMPTMLTPTMPTTTPTTPLTMTPTMPSTTTLMPPPPPPLPGSPEERISSSPAHECLPQPPAAKEAWLDIEEKISKAAARVETQVSSKLTRIHKFPHHLRGIGGADGCYIVPSVVAIGPYHHGQPHLEAMEEVKQAVAHQFCQDSGWSVKEVYEKIVSVAGHARRCYTSLVATLSDAEFAAMMFLDGCFLLQLMTTYKPPILGCLRTSGPNIFKDIFLLENQIPWLVLEALMEFRPVDVVNRWLIPVIIRGRFLESQEGTLWSTWFQRSKQIFLMKCCCWVKRERMENDESKISNEDSKPPHLLGLLRSTLTVGMPSQRRKGQCTYGRSRQLSCSAMYLAQIGMKLTASRATWFADMAVQEKPFFCELSLSPLLLGEATACYLVNFVALEAAEGANSSSVETDGNVMTSYLWVLTMLMDREGDVHELRAKGVLSSRFSNAETLAFFKGLGRHTRLGYNYYAVMEDIYEYMRKRPVRIAVYRFVHNHRNVIAAVLSIAGVLVGIFKALYSLKRS